MHFLHLLHLNNDISYIRNYISYDHNSSCYVRNSYSYENWVHFGEIRCFFEEVLVRCQILESQKYGENELYAEFCFAKIAPLL